MGISESRGISKTSTLKYSTTLIFSVFLIEILLGLAAGSLAILGDGLHALFDTLTSLMLFLSIRASLKPPDEEHMYGHEKFEPIGGLIGGLTLIVLAIFIAIEAIQKIYENKLYINLDLSLAGFIALGYTLSIDILRISVFKLTLESRSPTVKAGLYHALSDLGSTLVALIGFWLSASYKIFYGDVLASLILSALLAFLSARLTWQNIMELSDIAPKEVAEKIREEISKTSRGLFKIENLKVRRSGEKFFIRATLRVPDYMKLNEAHEITSKIEDNLIRDLGRADISFHIEPTGIGGITTEMLIKKLSEEIEGILDVHDISITHHEGKVYITLHVQVAPSTPLSEAHTLAEKLERRISESINNVENVLVHIEPSNIELKKGHAIDGDEINRLARSAVEKYGGELTIKRVITYMSNGKRCIDIECIFNREISVEEAHKIASEIENMMRERISEISITVHVEPKGKEPNSQLA